MSSKTTNWSKLTKHAPKNPDNVKVQTQDERETTVRPGWAEEFHNELVKAHGEQQMLEPNKLVEPKRPPMYRIAGPRKIELAYSVKERDSILKDIFGYAPNAEPLVTSLNGGAQYRVKNTVPNFTWVPAVSPAEEKAKAKKNEKKALSPAMLDLAKRLGIVPR